MGNLDETKRFNIEDITIDNNDKPVNEEVSEEAKALESSMEELDEIVSEDNGSNLFEDNEEVILDDSEALEGNMENFEEDVLEDNASMDFEEKNEEEIITNDFEEGAKLDDSLEEKEVDPALESIVKNDYQEKTIVEIELPKEKTIGIASDHRGYKLKQKLTKYLEKKGYTVIDFGADSTHSSDYPEFGFKLGEAVSSCEVSKGIAICGSGIGISIACNKIKGVRCAKVDNVKETKYARKDNDANVIAIAGNMPTFRAKDIVDAYLKTSFTGLERHKKRIEMLNNKG